MAWIQSNHTLRNHPKLFTLCKELKIERAQAVGHLHMLWWWALEHRENGDLIGLFDRDIAHACDWQGDPARILKALMRSGFLDKDMRIHDWYHYAGRLIRERERGRFRRKSEVPSADGSAVCSAATKQNKTEQNKRGKEKELKDPDFFSKSEKEKLLKRICEVRKYALESLAAGVALVEFEMICRQNKPKDPIAYVMGILKKEESSRG